MFQKELKPVSAIFQVCNAEFMASRLPWNFLITIFGKQNLFIKTSKYHHNKWK